MDTLKSLATLRVPFLPLLITFSLGVILGALLFGNAPASARAQGASAPDKATPTVNKKMNADQVDNVHAAKTPDANKLLALDANSKFPDAVIPGTISRTNHNHFGQTWTGSAAVGLGITNTNASNSSYSVLGTSTNGDGVKGASTNHNGVYGTSASSGASGVYGENNGGGYGVAGRVTNGGWAMYADGNVLQTRDKGGWVKAMALIDTTGHVVRCYNSQTSASSVDCGLTVNLHDTNQYDVNFGFESDDRFYLVSPALGQSVASALTIDGNRIRVKTYDMAGNAITTEFFLIVF